MPTAGIAEAAPSESEQTQTLCTVVAPGEGWWHQAEKLGIAGAQWQTLLAANTGSLTASGNLMVGAIVCLPGSDAANPIQAASSSATCTVAQLGDGWIAVGVRIGWPFSAWRELAAANPDAANEAGYLKVGAEVCAPS